MPLIRGLDGRLIRLEAVAPTGNDAHRRNRDERAQRRTRTTAPDPEQRRPPGQR